MARATAGLPQQEIDNIQRAISQAEVHLQASRDDEARQAYLKIVAEYDVGVAYFRLGDIFNRGNEPERSYACHLKALDVDPCLARSITESDHPFHDFEIEPVEQVEVTHCPLCGTAGRPHCCYNALTAPDFVRGFHPVRLWMHCTECHHIFAHGYPRSMRDIVCEHSAPHLETPKLHMLHHLGSVMAKLMELASGKRFLDVGAGPGTMMAVARELLCDPVGIEIRPRLAEAVSTRLGLPIHCCDFLEFQPDGEFDIICMGDVIEHLTNPTEGLVKAHKLLRDGGALWISTPNFESAMALLAAHDSLMWRVVEHLNYFSFASLRNLLEQCGFELASYALSPQYAGSMEVMAVKRAPRRSIADGVAPGENSRLTEAGLGQR